MNRLAGSKSPYLLQHAGNPVDWYPWGDEAFARAREEDKPVFLSVGYSTCHWCHVMAKESFTDPEVAGILNRHYVSVKVDREERPDVDAIYIEICAALTGQAGWPLTIIMTPDQKPFFAGTYFPKTARYGHPGLLQILTELARRWAEGDGRRDLLDAAHNITRLALLESRPGPTGDLSPELPERALRALESSFDEVHGGFDGPPKFPAPSNLFFLLRYHHITGRDRALAMAQKTLTSMRQGGVYDQVGFGFHRYSTDSRWLVPHFEKMLYDNALLALAYLEAHQTTKNPFFGRVAGEILEYILRDMAAPDGGFAAAQDADSLGREGRFYTWTPAEVTEVLGKGVGELFCRHYGITDEGNFEEGRSIPNLLGDEIAQAGIIADHSPVPASGKRGATNVNAKTLAHQDFVILEEARRKLLEARSRRVSPERDDKVLTAWNGLAVAALARGGRVMAEARYRRAAAEAAGFLLKTLQRPDGRLLARYRDGQADFPAYLDDYAFLVWGLIELWDSTFEEHLLQEALRLTRDQLDLFWDRDGGGFFFTGRDSEDLLFRTKQARDGALPSGNAVTAHNLVRLARLTGHEEWNERALAIFRAFAEEVSAYPSGFPHLLSEWQLFQAPAVQVVVAGRQEAQDSRELWNAVSGEFLPGAVLSHTPGGRRGNELAKRLPIVAGKEPRNEQALAYVCKGLSCREPVTEPEELRGILATT